MDERLVRLDQQSLQTHLRKIAPRESYVQSLSDQLKQTVFGQEAACDAIARAVLRHESGLSDPNRPLGVFFFLGPTGVGKTEMAHALAEHLFGDRDRLKLIDCAQLSEAHTVARLIGSPPGYVGYGDGLLINSNDLVGRNIMVFDEIEKAHPRVWKILLSVMETGRLTVREGKAQFSAIERALDFTESFVIFTSNVGSEEMQRANRSIGFVPMNVTEEIDHIAKNALYRQFQEIPEFLGRVDEITVFKPLTAEHYAKIFYKFLDEINAEAMQRNPGAHFIAATAECAQYIIEQATQGEQFGARNLRNAIRTLVLEPLSDIIMSGALADGEPTIASFEDGKIEFYSLWKSADTFSGVL